ncbi:hypothetical protein D3C81_309250 [compost metagenome]
MVQQIMYPAQPNSPQTELSAAITDTDTTIPLVSVAALPSGPNIATIGSDEMAEVVVYTAISGNALTGVTRGFSGTTAKSWGAGVKVARYLTSYDYEAFRLNILDARTDYVRSPGFGLDSGTANAKAITLNPPATSYEVGMGFAFLNNVENSGPVTINVDGIDDAYLRDSKGNNLTAGKLKADCVYSVRYNGEVFILQGEGGGLIPKLPNLIKYGSFENTGAASGAVYSNAQAKFGSYSLAITCPTGQLESTVTMGDLVTITAAHQYYISVWAYSATAGVSVQAYARTAEPSVTATLNTANTWTFISGILSFASSSTSYPRLDNNTPNTTIYFDGFMLIDLTDAYGSGNEPTQDEMDAIVKQNGGWWDTNLSAMTTNFNPPAAGEILASKVAFVNGNKVVGTMVRRTGGEFAGYERAVQVASSSGRVHLYAYPGAYIDTTADQGGGKFGVFADDANFISSNFPSDKNVFGLQGSMPRRGVYTPPISVVVDNTSSGTTFVRIPTGAYQDVSGVGYPEINIPSTSIASAAGITSGNLRSGVTYLGVTGSLTPRQYATGTVTVTPYDIVIHGLAFRPKGFAAHLPENINYRMAYRETDIGFAFGIVNNAEGQGYATDFVLYDDGFSAHSTYGQFFFSGGGGSNMTYTWEAWN